MLIWYLFQLNLTIVKIPLPVYKSYLADITVLNMNSNFWNGRLFAQDYEDLTQRLTHWGRVTHICISKLTIIDSDNGLSPGRRQAIIWANAGILLIRTSGTNFSEISSEIHTFSFKKTHSKMSSVKWRPFCLGLNELSVFKHWGTYVQTWVSMAWVNNCIVGCNFLWIYDAPLCHGPGSTLDQVMACHLFSSMPLPEPLTSYWEFDS